ncbi:hypothetical protein pVco7_gp014 [Vibrio phage pVco-7]|uniref:Uncharacterized protein n=1 Tax=Vibrio phage pVco-5 TaxID=1965485 RepID=A0A1W6JUP6_9CAUD|nr:hypothetical protein KNT61_gp015 [Vibrio phage pVco-5]ARM71003.1 hypothetical protein pVco5_015 [Vibrio phage pVco-5]
MRRATNPYTEPLNRFMMNRPEFSLRINHKRVLFYYGIKKNSN